ncbi:MAG: hypothetical protein M1825_003876 [Sarcosagium campestre]|nr:MAG: hypothetical protein M1825_003876 [Sarcosagium campestre]
MRSPFSPSTIVSLTLLAASSAIAQKTDILKTSGFSTCLDGKDIKVKNVNVQYDRKTNEVTFDVAGSSEREQKVTASLVVTAFGNKVYEKDFNPCDDETKVDQLCPVPKGNFAATGKQKIPDEFASQIPDIAFQIPDLDGEAKLILKSADGKNDLACIQSEVNNGKSVEVPGVTYLAAGVAGAALCVSGLSAVAAAGGPGGAPSMVSFTTVIGWFQSMALNGMLSVEYPPVYRSFSKNFAFSGGLIPWNQMQTTIDNFRNKTGGNLTEDSVQYLQNATLVYTQSASNLTKRGFDIVFSDFILDARDVDASVNGSDPAAAESGDEEGKSTHFVQGIQAYVERLMIPQSNTFMTVLLIFAIAIGAVVVGILLFKVILETWALFASFPKKLTGFRKRYWGIMARTIVNMILALYGVWTLYCVFQFTHGDSWAAKTLAGVTLVAFTAILGFFTFRIWQLARRYKKAEGDTSALFENKETWRKYSLFYDQYKKGYWWLFMPVIIYMFARGCVIAAGDGHGLAQTAGQLIIESLMLALLVWNRPFATKAGNWINVVIQVIRVLSVVCILVFVEQLGFAKTTQTITGVVLIAVQSALTGVLAILIAVNALIVCFRKNPHRQQRKEAEKLHRDLDNLTPLDPRNSLLMDPVSNPKAPLVSEDPVVQDGRRSPFVPYRDSTPPGARPYNARRESGSGLLTTAAPMPYSHNRTVSGESMGGSPPPVSRQPTLPNIGLGGPGGRGMAY